MIAGVDIGNSTTEVCIASLSDLNKINFLSSGHSKTIGIKGSVENIEGIKVALLIALKKIEKNFKDLDLIRINEATPVMGDTMMETITKTTIKDSAMIGHNPNTPAGIGVAVGKTVFLKNLNNANDNTPLIIVVNNNESYEEVANNINKFSNNKIISGIILQKDEAVLVYNRLNKKVPIIDETTKIELIEENRLCALEVSSQSESIKVLSSPYGIANLLNLTPSETNMVVPIARSLIGKRSGVVIKSKNHGIIETKIPAGKIVIEGNNNEKKEILIDMGAENIMNCLKTFNGNIKKIIGEENTNVGKMFERIKINAGKNFNNNSNIVDILAVDTFVPVEISGAVASDICMEKAVGISAMIKTEKIIMDKIAKKLESELGVATSVSGVEAVMAVIGALTTQGTKLPLGILDLGGGSTDCAVLYEDGKVKSIHLAGAGELVTMLICMSLNLKDKSIGELIKKYPVGKVESLFHLRLENGNVQFFDKQFKTNLFGKVVIIADNEYIPIEKENISINSIVKIRREAKEKVFKTNTLRALSIILEDEEIRNFPNIVLVGGSAEDFEIPQMLSSWFANYKIVCGKGNIRKTEGARNAVATGLVLSYLI